MILNTPFIAEWEAIWIRRQKNKNNKIEDKNRKPNIYIIHDKVLVCLKKVNNNKEPYVGPYPITQVWTNGNVTIRQGT